MVGQIQSRGDIEEECFSIDSSESEIDSDFPDSDNPDEPSPESAHKKQVLAKAETRAVRSLKLVLLFALTLSAVGVGLAVYFYTSRSEQAQFEVAFRGDANKVMEGIGKSLEKTLGALDEFMISLVTHARATNQTWPFVSIPKFGVRASKVRLLSDAVYLAVHPLVTQQQRRDWESYSLDMQGWVNESMKVQATDEFYYGPVWYNHSIHGVVHTDYHDVSYDKPLMLPTWQNSPVVSRWPAFNWDLLSINNPEAVWRALDTQRTIIGEAYNLPDMTKEADVLEMEAWVDWFSDYVSADEDPGEPVSDLYYPIIDSDFESLRLDVDESVSRNHSLVGLLMLNLYWRDLIKELLPQGSNGIDIVFVNPCNPSFTYRVFGPQVVYLGRGDRHEQHFNDLGMNSSLVELDKFFIRASKYTGIPVDEEYCPFSVMVHPSSVMLASYTTTNPIIFTIVSVLIFAFTSAVFIAYDCSVERRQNKIMKTAVRAETIVQSLFPAVVRDRIYPSDETDNTDRGTVFKLANSKTRLKTFLSDGTISSQMDETEVSGVIQLKSSPVAELFPDTTVMFADIVGFTAWSSVRDPTQVFTLLETLYGAFDSIARRRGVFKVETIGDSYVAVCGLPEPREDHAVVMARFARDCRDKMNELTRKLETNLGPDTGDLRLRFGLNSGPVTAGVLRGERARFQLFGDTVNCAARMESNGQPNRIQASQKTADLIIEAGKGHWITKRDDLVEAKGKGILQTYWIDPPSRIVTGTASESTTADADVLHILGLPSSAMAKSAIVERLIDWNVDVFSGLVKRIVARRVACGWTAPEKGFDPKSLDREVIAIEPRAEVREVILLPDFDFQVKSSSIRVDEEILLSSSVMWQLRDYVATIAYLYQANAFHNFEHASHVAMSILKLLQRVVTPEVSLEIRSTDERKVAKELASSLHSSTYGITSDPLTQFAIVFAALIHDVDHPGVSNGQLVAEHSPLAELYDNRSVAEQNSVSIAWQLLMRPTYADLRASLFATQSDMQRFRQLVVNLVMATDIFDKDLKAMRDARWQKAFALSELRPIETSSIAEDSNRKATIVLEHLIQAADVAHTMQHWMIYQKWNKRLFQEMYAAFKCGRSPNNPADGWYRGELWFFDNYIIPLARKLRECRVFGVSCDEFLNYALDNRHEWEAKGEAIVAELVTQVESTQLHAESSLPLPSSEAIEESTRLEL